MIGYFTIEFTVCNKLYKYITVILSAFSVSLPGKFIFFTLLKLL